jgi:hypothetical protein
MLTLEYCSTLNDSQDAFKVLQWLAYSARPLQIDELAEVIEVDMEGDLRFDPDMRLPDPQDILIICSSLVTTAVSKTENDNGTTSEIIELRLAHFSVKEYLFSDRVRIAPANGYSCHEKASTCFLPGEYCPVAGPVAH